MRNADFHFLLILLIFHFIYLFIIFLFYLFIYFFCQIFFFFLKIKKTKSSGEQVSKKSKKEKIMHWKANSNARDLLRQTCLFVFIWPQDRYHCVKSCIILMTKPIKLLENYILFKIPLI